MKTTTFGTVMIVHLNLALRINKLSATALSKAMGVTQSSLQRTLGGDTDISVSRMYDICHHANISAAYVMSEACKSAETLKDNGWSIVEKAESDDLLQLWKAREDWSWETPICDIFKLAIK